MKKLRHLKVCFTQYFLFFFSRYVRFSIAGILFVVRYLWGVCMCRDTSRSRLSHRLACLRSHVLRAYCNFESKQVISIFLDHMQSTFTKNAI